MSDTRDKTSRGDRLIDELAARHGFDADAVRALRDAILAGGGGQAQFSHDALGGFGQWLRGGMLMIGDMFNSGLKARVAALAEDLAAELSRTSRPAEGASRATSFGVGPGGLGAGWWPEELGAPSASGAQNELRYACFPARRRLAVQRGGAVTVYDTGEHVITGFAQQQGGGATLTFSSQLGPVRLEDLREVGTGSATAPVEQATQAAREHHAPPRPEASQGSAEIVATLEKLADLRARGILTDDEFTQKKTELLRRL